MTNMVNLANSGLIENHSKQSVNDSRPIRFALMISEAEDQAIQNYRFANRIGSKAEAARQLVAKGLEAEKMAATGVEIGVLSPVAAEDHNTHKECCDAAGT